MENLSLNKFKLEHTECDFKREVEHKKTKSWLKSVSAFANGIGGALIFGIDDENRQYCTIADLQSRIFCTRWNGVSKAPSSVDALDDKEFSGNILQLLTSSQDFIKIHNTKIWYKEPSTRIEKLSYPERAVFGVLVNALVHRDYGVIGSEIHIDMFDDRLTITNPGGMYDGVPVQDHGTRVQPQGRQSGALSHGAQLPARLRGKRADAAGMPERRV